MGGKASVPRHGGPLIVQDFHPGLAHVHHGLDGDDHAGHQPHAPSGGAVIGNAGVLVELRTYSVADEISYHRVTASFDIRLHRVADIANAVARDSLLNA